ncbi:MAG: porin family protein [Bacteroidales bacterium]|jgi:opacity protein-like surface antigen|nr:porin family protein [Bacteroidales bacterium]
MKFLVVFALLAFATESFAQTYGVKAGLNFSNMLMKDDDHTYSDDYEMKPGFHLGPVAEIPINDLLSFETGLIFSAKGFKYSEDSYDMKLNLFYLDIPLTAKARYDAGFGNIYGLIGPYLGIGLTGKSVYEDEDEPVDWGSDSDDDDLKRLDFGLTVGAGVEINSIVVGLSYGLGLANISPDTDGGFKINNRVLGLSVGYWFGAE